MLSKGTCVKIVAVSLLAVAAQHITRILIDFGAFSHFYKHYPGPCAKVENMQLGSEDFYTLPNGLTFITSGFRLQTASPIIKEHFRKHNIKGRIYLFDFKKADAGVTELKIASSEQFNVDTFHPHGISVWEEKKTGRHVVFVVNHPSEEPIADRIEKFVFEPEKLELVHQAYYSGEAMRVVNSVQPTGENSFYFSNYQYFLGPLGAMLEIFLHLEFTDVVHFDGKDYTSVAGGMKMPNGLAMSLDGHVSDVVAVSSSKFYLVNMFSQHSRSMMLMEVVALMPWSTVVFCEHSLCQEVARGLLGASSLLLSVQGERQYIYVAAPLGAEVRVFKRNADNSLTLQQVYPLYTAVDNILVDPATGDLYVGCHPIGYKVMQHLDNPEELTPSQVLQLRVKDGNITSAQEIFYDHGELISGSTSAIIYNRKLLIGSIYHNLVTCDVNIPL